MKQLDMFGNEVEIEEPNNRDRPKYKTMQELYGEFKGFNCKGCKHCIKYEDHNRTYYKCELWIVSNSEATDIKLEDVACKKFEV